MKQGYLCTALFLLTILGCGMLHAFPLDLLGTQVNSALVIPALDRDLGAVASAETWGGRGDTIQQFFAEVPAGEWRSFVEPALAGVFAVRHRRLLESLEGITSVRIAEFEAEGDTVTVAVKLFMTDFTSLVLHLSLRRNVLAPAGWYVQDLWEP